MSDLRAALERMVADWEQRGDQSGYAYPEANAYVDGKNATYESVADELRDLLAAHPTESAPRPVVDREALLHRGDVLAALEQVYNDGAMGGEWPTLGTDAVLELAQPMPTREQIAEVLREHLWIPSESRCSCGDEHIEFVSHHQAEAVLALLNGSES